MPDIGYYTLPVILSFQGIDAAVNKELGDALKPAAKKAGEDYSKGMTEGVKKQAPQVEKELTRSTKTAAKKAGQELDKELGRATKDAAKKAGQDAGKELEEGLTRGRGGGLKNAANDAAADFAGGFLDGMKTGLSRSKIGGTALGDLGGNVLEATKDSLRDVDCIGIGESVVDRIGDGIDKGDLSGVGRNLAEGFGAAFEGGLDEIKGAGKQWVDGVISDLKSGDVEGAAHAVTEPLRQGIELGGDLAGALGFGAV
jgi:vacuolar-type H+-ATPase subunit H